jgi:hypothetical protein
MVLTKNTSSKKKKSLIIEQRIQMKAFTLIAIMAVLVILLSNCHGSKKAMATTPKVTYEDNLKPIIAANCTPCHIPAKGGFKRAYDNYDSVRADIDEMIRRIELNPGDKGFMPFKKKVKLSDSTIAVFKQFRDDGRLEK